MRQMTLELAPDEVRRAQPPEQGPRPSSAGRRGPGVSKLAYRLSRAWAKPLVRNGLLVYLPLLLLGVAGWRVAADDELRGGIEREIVALVDRIAARPEFAVRGVAVIGGSESLQREVRRTLGIEPGVSSLKLDVEDLRRRVEDLGAVEKAAVRFDPQGTLRVSIVERIPAVLFRRDESGLVLLDKGGVEIGPAVGRAAYPELPVILGAGAPAHVGEVIALLGSAPDLVPRLRAFVRVGERRWDIVLDRDMVIKLPQRGAVDALSRVMALNYGDELLERDLSVIDMRLPDRPALRMNAEAAETYQIRKAVALIDGEET